MRRAAASLLERDASRSTHSPVSASSSTAPTMTSSAVIDVAATAAMPLPLPPSVLAIHAIVKSLQWSRYLVRWSRDHLDRAAFTWKWPTEGIGTMRAAD